MVQFEIFRELMSLVEFHPYLITFVASFLSEELLVFLAVLSGRGILSFWTVYVLGILGVMLFDSLIFIIGKSKFGSYIEDRFFPERKMDKKINFANKKRVLFYLIVTKFVWGTRIASIFYYSVRGMKYRRFILFNSISLVVWGSIMLSAGWLAGNGFDRILRFSRGVERFAAFILITILVIFFIDKTIKGLLKKSQK